MLEYCILHAAFLITGTHTDLTVVLPSRWTCFVKTHLSRNIWVYLEIPFFVRTGLCCFQKLLSFSLVFICANANKVCETNLNPKSTMHHCPNHSNKHCKKLLFSSSNFSARNLWKVAQIHLDSRKEFWENPLIFINSDIVLPTLFYKLARISVQIESQIPLQILSLKLMFTEWDSPEWVMWWAAYQ